MDFATVFAIAVGLSFDTFAVSLSYGVIRNKILFRQAVRIAVVLAFVQAGFLVSGFFLGSLISEIVKAADHWIALFLLLFLGIRMIMEGAGSGGNGKPRDFTRLIELLTAAVGTSIDAFAVGVSLALLKIQIWYSAVIVGAITFLASMTAIRIGKSAGARLGKRAEIIGGLILIAIGIRIFLEHTLAP